MVTIEDVARAAGVSTATVSRALRDLPNVSAATRERVLAAVDELGYRPDPTAQRLAAGRGGAATPAVGVVCIDPSEPATARMLAGVADVIDDPTVRAGEVTDPEAMVERILHVARRTDGVIVLGHALSDDELDALGPDRPTIVTAGALVDGLDGVMLDEGAAMGAAVTHLQRLGHDVIIHWDVDADSHVAGTPAFQRREAVAHQPGVEVVGVTDSIVGAAEGMDALLASPTPATALIAAGVSLGTGALLAARRLGIDIPADLSVVGLDPHDVAEVAGLTSVGGDHREVGRLAAGRLLSRIDQPAPSRHERLPVTFRVRGSTAPPGGGQPTDAVWL